MGEPRAAPRSHDGRAAGGDRGCPQAERSARQRRGERCLHQGMDVERSLVELRCARTRDLVRTPADKAELRRLTEAGRALRVGRGVYAVPGTPPDVVAATLVGGVPTCVSALRLLGLPLLDKGLPPHVAVSGRRSVPRPGLLPAGTTVHWHSAGPTAGLHPVPLPRALVHALRCVPFREVVAAADAGLNRGLVALLDLRAARPRYGVLTFERLMHCVDGRSQSFPESLLRLGLVADGLTVEPQARVDGVGRVDLLVEQRVVVEVDGFSYHAARREFQEDRRRDRAAQASGALVLRFTYDDAVWDTDRCVMEVRAAVDQSRGRRSPVVPFRPSGRGDSWGS